MNPIERFKKRKKICQKCENFKMEYLFISNKKIPRCIKCGCYLNMKWPLPFVKCPINKWENE
jgi:hypothetical protein